MSTMWSILSPRISNGDNAEIAIQCEYASVSEQMSVFLAQLNVATCENSLHTGIQFSVYVILRN